MPSEMPSGCPQGCLSLQFEMCVGAHYSEELQVQGLSDPVPLVLGSPLLPSPNPPL